MILACDATHPKRQEENEGCVEWIAEVWPDSLGISVCRRRQAQIARNPSRAPVLSFDELLLSPHIIRGLTEAGYLSPSPIQKEAIPVGKFGSGMLPCLTRRPSSPRLKVVSTREHS